MGPAILCLLAGLLAVALAPSAHAEDSKCHSSYEGACVPIARDVDCAGGGGNGPEYVTGPVIVVGDDVYELDRDGDGRACEPTGN